MIWYELESLDDLEELIQVSMKIPVVLFKHSTRCGISKFVLKHFERGITEQDAGDFHFYFLDLIRYREVSDQIADRFDVRHESPQVILISKGHAVYDASHHGIQAHMITERLKVL